MKQEMLLKYGLLMALIMALAAGGAIPYLYESPSIFYKTGLEKLLLRSGKILGIGAVILMGIQVILMGNFKFLTHLFKTKTLYQAHRVNGLILLAAALAHPVLILGADNFVFFPLEARYWPEIIGSFLLLFLILFVLFAVWQRKTKISYLIWKQTHRAGAVLLFSLVFAHVNNVSETFGSGIPFYGLCAVIGIAGLVALKKILG